MKSKKATFSLDEIRSYTGNNRNKLFCAKLLEKFGNDLTCKICDAKADHFHYANNSYQIICYKTINNLENKFFLTRDHIIPKSKNQQIEGNKYQTLCSDCNSRVKRDYLNCIEYFKIQIQYEKEYGKDNKFLSKYRDIWYEKGYNNFGWSF